MKKIYLIGVCLFTASMVFAQYRYSQDSRDEGSSQYTHNVAGVTSVALPKPAGPKVGDTLGIDDLSEQGAFFVKRIISEIQVAQKDIKGLNYPGDEKEIGRKNYLFELSEIVDCLTGMMDEYNALRNRDKLAAQVAGGYIAQALFTTKDGMTFQVHYFLDIHKADILDATLLEDLDEELREFSANIQEDFRHLKR